MNILNYHIAKVGFKNYRVFSSDQLHELELKPITFITGANSSGKSSVFKALMLLEENRKTNGLLKLIFSSGNHVLGSLKTIQNKSKENICFSFTRKSINGENVTILLEYSNKGILQEATMSLGEQSEEIVLLSFKNVDGSYDVKINIGAFQESDLLRAKVNFDAIYPNTNQKVKDFVSRNWKIWIEDIDTPKIDEELEELKDKQQEKINKEELTAFLELGFDKVLTSSEIISSQNIEDEKKDKALEIINEYEEKREDLKENLSNREEELREDIAKKYDESYSNNKVQFISNFMNEIKSNTIKNQLDRLATDFQVSIFSENILINLRKNALERINENVLKFDENEEPSVIIEILPSALPNLDRDQIEEYFESLSKILYDKDIHKVFYKHLLGDYIKMFFTEPLPFFHIPVDRGRQKRIVTFSNQNNVLENALAAIHLQGERNNDQKEFIRKWFCNTKNEAKFEIGYDYKIKSLEGKSIFFRIYNTEMDYNDEIEKGKTLADVGLGISQLMPIILSCINPNNKGRTIFIEEPETNLHPKFQSMLAEMFVDAARKFDIQFVLETHSEYLIRKMQELVASESIHKEDVIIYYFRGENDSLGEDEKRFEKIEFKEDGKIDYWKFGKGFYDTDYSLEFGLLNMQARILFQKMYEDLEGKTEEERITIIEERIDHYTQIQDLSKWEKQLKEEIPNFEKLYQKTKYYLMSAYFFIGMFDKSKVESAESNNIDFAPIIVQLGRAVETEMKKVFEEVLPIISSKDISFNYIQQKMEKKFTENSIKIAFEKKINNVDMFISFVKSTPTNLNSIKNTSTLLGIIRTYRNTAAHENDIMTGLITYNTLQKYRQLVIKFFKEWCNYLK